MNSPALEELTLGISERNTNEGTRIVANVRRTGDTTGAQVVNLSSGDSGELSAPATVTIPANEEWVMFFIDAVNDGVRDTAQVTELTASATGFSNAVNSLSVGDAVAAFSPVDDTLGVAIDSDLEITFDRPFEIGTGDILIRRVDDDSIVETLDVVASVSAAGFVATIDPADLSLRTEYYVEIPSSAFKDPLGNHLIGVNSKTIWNFTTIGGMSVTETGVDTNVSETGSTDTFDVVLTAQPASDVVINVTSGDAGEATVDLTTLTFTSANWDTAQTVTVTGVDDPTVDGDQTTTITVSVDDANSDDAFDPLADLSVTVTTTDDDSGGFSHAITGADTTVSESGTTDTFTVVLTAQPVTDVVITVSSADTDEAAVNPATLTFTNANWDTAQTVTVTGVDDPTLDGDQTTVITLSKCGRREFGRCVRFSSGPNFIGNHYG